MYTPKVLLPYADRQNRDSQTERQMRAQTDRQTDQHDGRHTHTQPQDNVCSVKRAAQNHDCGQRCPHNLVNLNSQNYIRTWISRTSKRKSISQLHASKHYYEDFLILCVLTGWSQHCCARSSILMYSDIVASLH